MTNRRYLKMLPLADMLEGMNRNITDGDCGCIIEAVTGDYKSCPKEMTCRECIEHWLKAEKEDYSL